MMESEWEAVIEDACGIWNANPASELGQARIKTWHTRWRSKPNDVFVRAIRKLEQTHRHWPSVADVHAAVDAIERTDRLVQQAPPATGQQAQIDPRTRRELARELDRAVKRSLVRSGGEWTEHAAYLQQLADLYRRNADLSEQGRPIEWPPWRVLGGAPAGLGPDLARSEGPRVQGA